MLRKISAVRSRDDDEDDLDASLRDWTAWIASVESTRPLHSGFLAPPRNPQRIGDGDEEKNEKLREGCGSFWEKPQRREEAMDAA